MDDIVIKFVVYMLNNLYFPGPGPTLQKSLVMLGTAWREEPKTYTVYVDKAINSKFAFWA